MIGAGLAVAFGVTASEIGGFLSSAERVSGRITSVGNLNIADTGYPVEIAFVDTEGEPHTLHVRAHDAPTGSLTHPYRVGADIDVVYQPEAPASTARVGRFVELWTWPIVWGLGAIVAFVTGGVMLWLQRR